MRFQLLITRWYHDERYAAPPVISQVVLGYMHVADAEVAYTEFLNNPVPECDKLFQKSIQKLY